MKSPSEKAANALIEAVSSLDFSVHLFAGYIMAHRDYRVKRRIVETFLAFLTIYRRNAQNPSLNFTTGGPDPQVESIDLTGFDQ